jgi:hypothetical protein
MPTTADDRGLRVTSIALPQRDSHALRELS